MGDTAGEGRSDQDTRTAADKLRHAAAERAELAALLRGLTPAQWEAPSLCAGWRVRDVVAHLTSYDGLSAGGLAKRFAQGRFWLDRANAVGVEQAGALSHEQLLQRLEDNVVPSGLARGFGGSVGLVDSVIHQQDIRRALGLPREVPLERVRAVLPVALGAPPVHGFWHVRGVRVVATDVDWAAGRGPEARGPAEAVMMTVAGRRGAARELSGPGAARLVDRLG